MKKIKVLCLNLANRLDRNKSIIDQFSDKAIFDLKIINPIPDTNPKRSIWVTLQCITHQLMNEEFFILCEDDHIFTNYFNEKEFLSLIKKVKNLCPDILSGGMSWVDIPIEICNNIFCVEKFSGLQFTVIFNQFYRTIINSTFLKNDIPDKKISTLAKRKMVVFPFVSIQKDFGYSDVTTANNEERRVEDLFEKTQNELRIIHLINNFYCNEK